MLVHRETKHIRLSSTARWHQTNDRGHGSIQLSQEEGVTNHFELQWRCWFWGGGVIPSRSSVHGLSGPQLSVLLAQAQHASLYPTLKETHNTVQHGYLLL